MSGLIRSFSALAQGYVDDLSDPILGETDLILNQLPAGLLGADLAEKFNIPVITVAVIPLVPTKTSPMVGMPSLPVPGYNRFTYFVGEQVGWQLFRRIVNRWRKETLHLPVKPLFTDPKQYLNEPIPVLMGVSEAVVPRPVDWGSHVIQTGYWYQPKMNWQPPEGLHRFLENGKPPIFIGFGSMPVKDPQKMTIDLITAVQRCGERVVLHAGWGSLGAVDLPETIFKIDYAPYDWLFPRMAAVFHHGGSGTTGYALRSGVPSVVVPFVFDQFYWGKRCAELGLGPGPLPVKKLTTDRLVHKIDKSLSGRTYRQNAQSMAKKLAEEDGVQRAVSEIQTILK